MLVNADVRPTGGGSARGEAVAWKDGRVLAVGSRTDVELEAGPDVETWDAGGTTVLIATHDRELIRLVGRRSVTLDSGRIVEMAEGMRAGGPSTTPSGRGGRACGAGAGRPCSR